MSKTDRKDQDELVDTLASTLSTVSDAMAKAVGDDDRDASGRLTAVMMGLTAASAAGLLRKLWREQQELEAAIQAAVESLEGVQEAGAVRAMLQAVLVES